MPVHKIPFGHLHEDLIDIERQGETVVTVTTEGRYHIVTTVFRGDRRETRINVDELAATVASDGLAHSFLTDDIVRRDG